MITFTTSRSLTALKNKVIIIGAAYPLRGGLAAFNERIARAFMEQGYEVVIHTFSMQYPRFLFPGKTQYSEGPPPEGLDIRVSIHSMNPINWIRVGRQISRERPELVVVKFWLPFMALCFGSLACFIRRNRYTKVISILDNVIPHERHLLDVALIRFFVRRVDAFIAMSESVLRELRRFNMTKPALYSPHPLYDHFGEAVSREEALRALGHSREYKYLLFFGFIRDYKGLDLLLHAFASCRLRTRNLRLIVAGEYYTDPRPYLEIIDRYGMSEEVYMHTDYIPDEKVSFYFSAADLVVQPYKTATQSGVTQIAYHFDKPMLVTRTGGLAEMVPHGKAGYVVEPDPGKIASAIDDFFENNRYNEMSAHVGKEKKKYHWSNMIKAIENLHKQLKNRT